MPAGSPQTLLTADRIRRFSKVRVTARLACRFGTTSPSQQPDRPDSSTGGQDVGAGAVDKSALLLPKDPTIDPSPEELALRLQLRLERLNAMRESGARLMARDRIGRDVFLRGAPEGLRVVKARLWDCDYFELITAYGQIKARTQPVFHVVKKRAVMTLEEALERVSAMIGRAVDWTAIESFLPDFTEPALRKSALASSFVAALELAKRGSIDLQQENTFAPLMVRIKA